MSHLFTPDTDFSEEKKRLYEMLLKEEGIHVPQQIQIARRNENLPPPLSFAQQRLWLLDQIEPGSAYSTPALKRLLGDLNVSALESSLKEIIRRHDSLRTSFQVRDGQSFQVIAEPGEWVLEHLDLSHLAAEEREHEASRLIMEEGMQVPFDLARGPLFRATLLKLAEQDHVLFLNLHHIISDGWSMGLLFKELAVLYNAYVRGQESPLEELAIQYADYSVWQREYLQGEVLDKQLSYWKEQLRDAPAVSELPTDYPLPSTQSRAGATESFVLSKRLTEQLKRLSQHERVTLFMTLLAAFQVLLSRYSGQQDIVVGTPVAGRNRKETESLIGFFVNTLAMRTDLSGRPSFRELLKRVSKISLEAYAHQEIPFQKLIEEIRPGRTSNHHPLFEVFFSLNNASSETFQMDGLRLGTLDFKLETTQFNLMLTMTLGANELTGTFCYSTELFEAATIRRMAEHFRTLLRAIVARPDMPLNRLPLLTEPERKQLFLEWNDTRQQFPHPQDVVQLIEQQALLRPQAIAVLFQDDAISYEELNERANQLAHYLIQQGVGAESIVGILLDRSLEMIVSLLAVLKAGAAYLPLDPGYPQERLRFMVEDSGTELLLTEKRVRERVGELSAKSFCLDTEAESLQRQSLDNPESTVNGENLSYVIYTSGSTGLPKGVMVRRHALHNFLQSMLNRPGLSESDVVAAVTTLSFDMAALELLLPLVVGARLVVVSRAVSADAAALTRLLKESGATLMQATPSTWRMLIETGWHGGEQFKALCGGEALSQELSERLKERVGQLWNMYGPTETTIWSTSERVESGSAVSIGRPIANTEVYVLDSSLEPVPLGVKGELYIGGDGLGRGYLGNPELTAERFIPDGFGERAGSRLYRTGDVVRWREDGRLEYVGRSDYQVKVRGYRIELGEVEGVLEEHESVRECVVARAENQLVAYVVLQQGAEKASAAELRQHVRSRLPEYMVPNLIVELAEMPLTANGKVDRKRLPSPEYERLNLGEEFVGAQTPLEREVSRIWGEVLQLERVGVHDNFFDLGGHSLLAMMVITRMQDEFGVELSLRAFFESPTIAELSKVLIEQMLETEGTENILKLLDELEVST